MRTDLPAFAAALAARLPGTWVSEHHRHTAYDDQSTIAERLWDIGHVDYIVGEYVLGHHALLNGPNLQQLFLTDRPLYRNQFVVAPLLPQGFQPHQIDVVNEPNGIAIPNDPARAAVVITRRLLPRYRHAVGAARRNALTQPEPPRRPAAPETAETLTLTWYPDGVVGAPYESVPSGAHTVLYSCRFQYSPHESAFILPAAYSTIDRALLLQTAVQQLTARGIGVSFRHAAPANARPMARQPSAALGTQPLSSTPPRARR